MKPLTREEMISVIEGKGAADRIPMMYHFWTNADTFGENAPLARKYLEEYPMDVQSIGVWMPDTYNAPADNPRYRWLSRDKVINPASKAIDSQIAIENWDYLDEIIENFPNADYPAIWNNEIPSDGRYRLMSWCYWLFERHWSLRGMENALTDYYIYPEETHRLFDALTTFYCGIIENGKKHYNLDGVFITDDIGTQTAPFFSMEVFDEFFKPYYKRVADCAHKNNMHLWMHACGNIELFIPSLIEIGVDVLHPIQKHTMSEIEIAKKYGDKLCIFAGFDVQQAIPYGTVEDVRNEIHFLIDTYARKDGRLILTMGNGITPDCPIESLYTLLKESYEYGTEKIRQLKK